MLKVTSQITGAGRLGSHWEQKVSSILAQRQRLKIQRQQNTGNLTT